MNESTKPDNIGTLLRRAFRAFEGDIARRLNRRGYLDIRVAHGALFAHLDQSGTRLTDLAQRARMTKQSMGELAIDLVAKGYVALRRDPRDQRAKLVVLTDRGRRHVRDAHTIIREIETGYELRFGKERMATLRSTLEKIIATGERQGRGVSAAGRPGPLGAEGRQAAATFPPSNRRERRALRPRS